MTATSSLDDEHVPAAVFDLDAARVGSFAKGYAAIRAALRKCTRKAVARVVDFPFEYDAVIVGVEPAPEPEVVRYRSAAALVKARCGPRLPRPEDVNCTRDGLDRMSCTSDSDDGRTGFEWSIEWTRERWRLDWVERTVLGGE